MKGVARGQQADSGSDDLWLGQCLESPCSATVDAADVTTEDAVEGVDVGAAEDTAVPPGVVPTTHDADGEDDKAPEPILSAPEESSDMEAPPGTADAPGPRPWPRSEALGITNAAADRGDSVQGSATCETSVHTPKSYGQSRASPPFARRAHCLSKWTKSRYYLAPAGLGPVEKDDKRCSTRLSKRQLKMNSTLVTPEEIFIGNKRVWVAKPR